MKLGKSSVGKKIILSLAGVFLMTFLLVHLGINFLLLLNDGGELYNIVAHFMSTNVFIKFIEITLFGGFFIHIIYAIIITLKNLKAKGSYNYLIKQKSQTSLFAKYTIHTAIIILIFLILHLIHFFFKTKFGIDISTVIINNEPHKNLAKLVYTEFKNTYTIIIYIISFIALSFHLYHGLASAFQTIGLRNEKYEKIIKILSATYSITIGLGFSSIALIIYFFK